MQYNTVKPLRSAFNGNPIMLKEKKIKDKSI